MAGAKGLEPSASAVTVTGLLFSTTYMSAETAKVRESHVRRSILLVELWVEKCMARVALGGVRHDPVARGPLSA